MFTKKLIFITLLIHCIIPTMEAQSLVHRKKIALVIGNAHYENDRLANPIHDAEAIAAFLTQTGFTVTQGHDLSKEKMEQKVDAFAKQIGKEDISFFFFSGHGMQSEGKNYLIPIDARLETGANTEMEREAYNLDKILEKLGSKKHFLNMIFLDACRDNHFPRPTRSMQRGLTAIHQSPPKDILISFAAQAGQTARDGDKNSQNSPYTAALLNAFKQNCINISGYLPIIKELVRQKTGELQIPDEKTTLSVAASKFSFICSNTPPPPQVWKFATTWSRECKIMNEELQAFVKEVNDSLNGKLHIDWETTPKPKLTDWFYAVKENEIQMLHGSPNYWKEEIPGTVFFAAIPFGMVQAESERWLQAGGLALWRDLYEPYGLKPFPCGHSGMQMGGWFNKLIDSVQDFNNMWIRVTGLGGRVYERFGARTRESHVSEIYTFLKEDSPNRAAEYVGPYDDYNLGLHHLAKYYYEGWQEYNTIFELLINQRALDGLDVSTQRELSLIIEKYNERIYRKYETYNALYRKKMVEQNIQFRTFPKKVLDELRIKSREVIQAHIDSDPTGKSKIIFESYQKMKRI
jgi:TRAP-type mannitol/chloroaromatic compound transport system substrate-binding protein